MAQTSAILVQPPAAGLDVAPAPQAPGRAVAANAGLPDMAALLPGYGRRSRQGDAALRAVARGILERVARYGTLRVETVPATWPMTRHLVRRVADALVGAGLLEHLPDGALRATGAGVRAMQPLAADVGPARARARSEPAFSG